MFALKKIITPFLVPPGIFIALLFLSAFWFLCKKRRAAAAVNGLLAILLWVAAVSPVQEALLRGLEGDFSIPADPKGDVIILLGGGVYDSVPDLSGAGAPTDNMIARIVTAVRLQKRLGVPVIISGGAVFEGGKAEAPIVRRFLIDLGVPPGKVIMEDRSRDTIENARYTIALCRKHGFTAPLLVTSASHMKRSVMSFRKMGMEVTPIPSSFKTGGGRTYGWHDFLPQGVGETTIALKEYLGLLFYTFAY